MRRAQDLRGEVQELRDTRPDARRIVDVLVGNQPECARALPDHQVTREQDRAAAVSIENQRAVNGSKARRVDGTERARKLLPVGIPVVRCLVEIVRALGSVDGDAQSFPESPRRALVLPLGETDRGDLAEGIARLRRQWKGVDQHLAVGRLDAVGIAAKADPIVLDRPVDDAGNDGDHPVRKHRGFGHRSTSSNARREAPARSPLSTLETSRTTTARERGAGVLRFERLLVS